MAEAEAKVAQARADAEWAHGLAQEAVQAADALCVTVDELGIGQGPAADLAAAKEAARQAEEQTEALRQAEAERKARGRLRRAWDGWRGR